MTLSPPTPEALDPAANPSARVMQRVTAGPIEVRSIKDRIVRLRLFGWSDVGPIGTRLRERIARRALDNVDPTRVKLRSHLHGSEPVGRGLSISEDSDPAGPTMDFYVTRTARGDDLLELIGEGLLGGVSIEFAADPDTDERTRTVDGAELITRNRIDLRGVLVCEPDAGVYPTGAVLAVRTETLNPTPDPTPNGEAMSTDTTPETTPDTPSTAPATPAAAALTERVDNALAELEERTRRLEVGATVETRTAAPDLFTRSRDLFVGNLIAKVEGNRELLNRALADVTGTTGGAGPDASGLMPESWWTGDLLDVVDTYRPVWTVLGDLPFPARGTSVTVPAITQHTQVGKRTGQKEAANSRSLQVTAEQTPAQWFDGAVDVALELIQQAGDNPAMLDLVWRDLLGQYAIAVEAYAVEEIDAAAVDGGTDADYTDPAALYGLVAAANLAVKKATNLPASAMLIPEDDWPAFAGMVYADGRPVFPAAGPTNTVGTGNVTSLELNYGGLRAIPAEGLPAGFPIVTNGRAVIGGERGPDRVQTTNVELMGVDVGIIGPALVVARIPAGVIRLSDGAA